MYTRVNMLIRKFHKCSTEVKIRLFRAYCICLYGSALWTHFAAESLNKFRRCYHKCIKMIFGYSKYHSVTAVLFDLKLSSFNTIMHNFRHVYSAHWWSSGNMLIINLRNIGIVPMCSWCVLLTVFVLLFVCACIYIFFFSYFLLLGLDDMGFYLK